MKHNIKTFWKGLAQVPDKCRTFQHPEKDLTCRWCPHFQGCCFMRDFTAELREQLDKLGDIHNNAVSERTVWSSEAEAYRIMRILGIKDEDEE